MPLPQHVIISGAGLAGPALAIALAKQSIKSTILERRPFSQDIGGVIMLAPNAMRVLEGLVGVGDTLRGHGYPFDAIHIFTKGWSSFDKVGGFILQDEGCRAISIARPILHDVLLDKCKEMKDMIEIKFSAKLVGIEEDDHGVEAMLEGGESVKGDILIGADGIGSAARKHVLGKREILPKYSGIVAIGCVVPNSIAKLPDSMPLPAFIYMPSGTFLIFAMDSDRKEIQWATTVKTPERDRKSGWDEYRTSGQALAETKEEYKDVTAEPVRTLIEHLSTDNVKLWAPYEVPDLPTWHTDRVCLIGDAAHALPPSAGQGSAQAFEDVGLLARLLASPAAVDRGYGKLFTHFEANRRKRLEVIRKMTANAEAGRGRSSNVLTWWFKSWTIWAGLNLFGKSGYVKGRGIMQYNVLKEGIDVV